jgi:hypothetical protein
MKAINLGVVVMCVRSTDGRGAIASRRWLPKPVCQSGLCILV